MQARYLAFDVEVADLAEIEELFVEAGPLVQAPAIDVVGQVVDIVEAGALRPRIAPAEPVEIHVIDRALRAVAVDQIDLAARRCPRSPGCSSSFGADACLGRLGAERQARSKGPPRVHHPEGHRRRTRPVSSAKLAAKDAGLRVDDEVDVALTIERDVLGAVLRDGAKPMSPNRRVELSRDSGGNTRRIRSRRCPSDFRSEMAGGGASCGNGPMVISSRYGRRQRRGFGRTTHPPALRMREGQTASGWFSGAAFWKASSFSQALLTATIRG